MLNKKKKKFKFKRIDKFFTRRSLFDSKKLKRKVE